MDQLTSAQRKYLKSQAHHLTPVIQVGRGGVTEALLRSIDKALKDHELIKIKFISYKEEKKDLSELIIEKTQSHRVGMIGHVLILYRQQEDPDKRFFHLS